MLVNKSAVSGLSRARAGFFRLVYQTNRGIASEVLPPGAATIVTLLDPSRLSRSPLTLPGL